jgi:hypothetical protein
MAPFRPRKGFIAPNDSLPYRTGRLPVARPTSWLSRPAAYPLLPGNLAYRTDRSLSISSPLIAKLVEGYAIAGAGRTRSP